MRRRIGITILGCATLLAICVWLYRLTAPPPAPRTVVMRLGDFTWRDLAGRPHRLSEFAGKPVIVHFWASWCAPCAAEFPGLLAYGNRPGAVTVLAVSSDQDRAAAVRFVAQMEQQAGVQSHDRVLFAFDPDRAITYDVFQTALYPETVVLDAVHRLRRKFGGVVDWNNPETPAQIEAIVRPVPRANEKPPRD